VVLLPEIPVGLQELVEQELDQGESIRWIEQPIPRFFTTPRAAGVFLFAIAWTSSSLLLLCSVLDWSLPVFGKMAREGGPISAVDVSFSLLFVLVGIAMLAWPLWAHWKGLRTVYVITDRRAITFERSLATRVTSYTPFDLRKMFRKEKKNGTGDLVFGHYFAGLENDGPDGSTVLVNYGFLRVRDVRKTEQMLRELTGHDQPHLAPCSQRAPGLR
jgi:hypothetical protein